MEVQIFGVQKNQNTRKALRFFSERRITVHFVDFKVRLPSKGELQRFAQRFGISAMIDRDSSRYAELGLGATRYDDASWLGKLTEEPMLLVMPLARCQHKVTMGLAEAEWKSWVEAGKT